MKKILLFLLLFCSPLVAQCESVMGTEVPLYWDANVEPNIEYYRLQRSNVSGSGYAVVNTVFQAPDPISTSDFSPLPTGYYVVSAVDTDGQESGLSNELCVAFTQEQPPGSPPFPTAPQFEIITIPGD